MYCSNCGAKQPDNQHFCTNCGHKLESVVPMQDPATAEPAAAQYAENPDALAGSPVDSEVVSEAPSDAENAPYSPGASNPYLNSVKGASAPAGQGRPYSPSQPAGLNPIPRGGRSTQGASVADSTATHMPKATPSTNISFLNMDHAQQNSNKQASLVARVGAGIGAVALIVSVGVVAYVSLARQQQEVPAATTQAASTEVKTQAATEAATDAATKAKTDTGEVKPKKNPSEYSLSDLGKIANKIEKEATNKNEAFDIARTYNLVDKNGKLANVTWDFDLQREGITTVRLVDIYHDKLADGGYAAFTFMNFDEPKYSGAINQTNSNAGGWKDSHLRNWLNDTFKQYVSPDVAKYVKPVIKYTNNLGQSNSAANVTQTEDYYWIPSVVELTGPVSWTWDSNPGQSENFNAVLNAEGSQYLLFVQQHANPSDEVQPVLSNGYEYHLRSASTSVRDHFRYVGSNGDPSLFGDADVRRALIISFCM